MPSASLGLLRSYFPHLSNVDSARRFLRVFPAPAPGVWTWVSSSCAPQSLISQLNVPVFSHLVIAIWAISSFQTFVFPITFWVKSKVSPIFEVSYDCTQPNFSPTTPLTYLSSIFPKTPCFQPPLCLWTRWSLCLGHSSISLSTWKTLDAILEPALAFLSWVKFPFSMILKSPALISFKALFFFLKAFLNLI